MSLRLNLTPKDKKIWISISIFTCILFVGVYQYAAYKMDSLGQGSGSQSSSSDIDKIVSGMSDKDKRAITIYIQALKGIVGLAPESRNRGENVLVQCILDEHNHTASRPFNRALSYELYSWAFGAGCAYEPSVKKGIQALEDLDIQ